MRFPKIFSYIHRFILPWVLVCTFGLYNITNASPPSKVTIALARSVITPAEETFTIAVPRQLGYFEAEGLKVTVVKTSGSTAALQAVANGNADIAYASSVNIAMAIENGLPVKAFAGLTVKWPYYIAVPEGSSIKTLADLRGKRIGVISMASASYADLKANLHYAGLSENDVTIIAVGAGIKAAIALQNQQIDAIDSYSDSFTLMQQNGFQLTMLPRPTEMEQLFSVTMVTNNSMLQERPDVLIGYARAAYKGIIYTYLYPDSALALSFKEFPELPGSEDSTGQDAKNTREAMLVALRDSIPGNNSVPASWGQWLNIKPERWQILLDFAYATGQTDKLMKPEQVWDNSLMPEIYNFDINTITHATPNARIEP